MLSCTGGYFHRSSVPQVLLLKKTVGVVQVQVQVQATLLFHLHSTSQRVDESWYFQFSKHTHQASAGLHTLGMHVPFFQDHVLQQDLYMVAVQLEFYCCGPAVSLEVGIENGLM